MGRVTDLERKEAEVLGDPTSPVVSSWMMRSASAIFPREGLLARVGMRLSKSSSKSIEDGPRERTDLDAARGEVGDLLPT